MERLMKLLKLKVPLPLQSVRNRRSFLYVGNLVNAICVALEHPAAARKTFCVSDGNEMSTADLLRGLGRASGQSVRLFSFPRSGLNMLGQIGSLVTRMTGRSIGFDAPAIEKLCGSLAVDSSLFRQTCGWKPPFSTKEGLMATVGHPVGTD
jgi:nucleoside-diphosphate-sugar epimerase